LFCFGGFFFFLDLAPNKYIPEECRTAATAGCDLAFSERVDTQLTYYWYALRSVNEAHANLRKRLAAIRDTWPENRDAEIYMGVDRELLGYLDKELRHVVSESSMIVDMYCPQNLQGGLRPEDIVTEPPPHAPSLPPVSDRLRDHPQNEQTMALRNN